MSYDDILEELGRVKVLMDQQGEVIVFSPFGGALYKALRIYDGLYDRANELLQKVGWYEKSLPWHLWKDWQWVLRTHWCI